MKNDFKLTFLGALIFGAISFIFLPQESMSQTNPLEPGVMTEVDEQPLPLGGMEEMYSFFKKSMKYPAQAKEKGIEGTVVTTFLVQKDGSLTDVEILRGIGGYCDEEAIRLIKSMPTWQPGKIKGEAVVTRMRIPVRFKLD